MFEDKNILVTGGTGFVGSNFMSFFRKHAPNAVLYIAQRSNGYDLTIKNPFEEHKIDYVFHCAAYTGGAQDIVNNLSLIVRENTYINTRLIDSAAKSGVKKFVFISSSAVYAEPKFDGYQLCESEGYDGIPAAPLTMPGYMKRYGEQMCEFYHKQYGMEVLVVRPANLFGKFSNFDPEKSHVIPALIRKFVEKQKPLEIWGDPKTSRDFVYIDDFVKEVVRIFTMFSGFEIINVGSEQLVTMIKLGTVLSNLTGYNGELHFNKNKPSTFKSKLLSTTYTHHKYGKMERTPLEVGLQETINWYKEGGKR